MGCGAQTGELPNFQELQDQLAAVTLQKKVIYDDRISLVTEVSQMRSNVSDMLWENETLKRQMDMIMSSHHPSVFSDVHSQDELIANWREMDLQDGDNLLGALSSIHKGSKKEVEEMLKVSSSLKGENTSLQEYCGYFSLRFEFFNKVWQRAVLVTFALEEATKKLKEETAVSLQSIESMLGKRSPPLVEIQGQFRDLIELENSEFLLAYRTITQKIFSHKVDNFNKRLDEKDAEKQRVINWYDAEIAKIRNLHREELAEKDRIKKQMLSELQAKMDASLAQAAKELDLLNARHLQERDRITWQYNEDRVSLRSKLDKKTRDLQEHQSLADKEQMTINKRYYEEKIAMMNAHETEVVGKEKIIKELREALDREIERRIREVKEASEGQEDQLQTLVNEHTVDFAKLRRKMETETEKHEMTIRKLETQHKQLITELEEQQKKEIEAIRQMNNSEIQKKEETLKKVQSDNHVYVSRLIEKHRADVAKLLASSQEDIKSKDEFILQIRSQNQAQIEELTTSHSKEIADLRKSLTDEIYRKDIAGRKVEQDHQTAIQDLMDKFRDDIEKLRIHHQSELRAKDELLIDADRKNVLLTDKFRADLAEVRQTHYDEINRKDALLEKMKVEHRSYVDELSERLYKEIGEMRTVHAEEIKVKEEEARKVEESHKTAIQELMDKFRSDLDRIRTEHQKDLQLKDQQIAASVQESQQQMTNYIAKADLEIAHLRAAHSEEIRRKEDALDKAHESHRAEIKALLQKAAEDSESQQQLFSEESKAKILQTKQLQAEYESKLSEMERKQSIEIAEMRKGYLGVIQQKEELTRKMQVDNDIKLAEIVDKYREDLEQARQYHQSDTLRLDEQVDKVQSEHNKQISDLVERYTMEMAHLRTEHSEEMKRKEDMQRQAIKDVEMKVKTVSEKLTAEIDALTKKHSQESSLKDDSLRKARLDFDSRLQDQADSHIKDIQRLRDLHAEEAKRREDLATALQAEHSTYVSSLMDKFRADLAQARLLHQEDIARKDAQISQLESDHQSAISSLISKYTLEISDLRQSHTSDLHKKDQQIDSLTKTHENWLRDSTDKHSKELENLRQTHRSAIKEKEDSEQRTISSYESQLSALSSKLTLEIRQLKDGHNSDIEQRENRLKALTIEHKSEVESLIDKFMSESAMQKKDFEAEIKRRDDTIESIKSDSEKSIQLLKLAHLNAVKSMESEHALAIAQKNRKESENAESLLHLIEEFVKQTDFIKVSHSQTQEKQFSEDIRPKIRIKGSTPRLSQHIIAMEIDVSHEGNTAKDGQNGYLRAFSELQGVLDKEKVDFETQLARDREIIRILELSLRENTAKCERFQQEIASDGFKIMGLEAMLADKERELEDLRAKYDKEKYLTEKLRKEIAKMEKSLESRVEEIRGKEETLRIAEKERKELAVLRLELEEMVREYKGMSLKEQQEMQNHYQRSQEDLSHRDAKIKELAETLREKEIKHLEEVKKVMMKGLIMKLLTSERGAKSRVVAVWKLSRRAPPPPSIPAAAPAPSSSSSEAIMADEKGFLLENNLLLDIYKKTGKGEKPLALNQVLKFFEEIMDRKAEADAADLMARRVPKGMQEFLVEHLTKTFGLRKLALKMVCQLVPALILHHRDQHPEVLLFCRFLQLINPNPIPFPLCIFLTKIRSDFSKYAKTYNSERGLSSTGVISKAYLVDIFAYVYGLFEDDRESGEDLLRKIRPEAVEIDQYVLFCICNKMAILSMNSEDVFNKMDSDANQSMTEAEFISGVQKALELWISASDLKTVFHSLAGEGGLTKIEFVSHLNFKHYLEKCRSDLFAVSKTDFLNAVAEVYMGRQMKVIERMLGEVEGVGASVDEEVHERLVGRINPRIDANKAKSVWTRATELSKSPQVPLSLYIRILLRYSIAPQGVFSLIDDLPLWAEMSGSEGLESDSGSGKVPGRREE